ncbi:RluA family pseudouridine synthase [Eubacteriales bacterium OttesenSCG-928-M02]|nr:RluA family pseudouridine synthase [Eubacteriales bacterium OttesenSCG-928-M02]
MMERFEGTIPSHLDGERMDSAFSSILDRSRSFVAGLIVDGYIFIDEKAVTKASKRVVAGESYHVTIPPAVPLDVVAQDIPIDIVYEDGDIAIINKNKGMVVHPSHGNESGTLVNALLYHLNGLSGIGGVERPGIVHRLDKDTTGLLVVAKNDKAHESLASQLKEREVKRTYLCLVHGNVREDMGEIAANIGRHPTDRKRMAVVENGRFARTHYKVIDRLKEKTLLLCRLDTGRTHQIRVHMQYMGNPVVGDPMYGRKRDEGGQMLHAVGLGLIHPITGKRMQFFAPPPENFLRQIRAAGGRADIARYERLCQSDWEREK